MNRETIKVLLVEDNPGDARLIEEMLGEADTVEYDIAHVKSLDEGLKRLAIGGIDLILLDLGLPDSQGLNTIIKTHAVVTTKPIVVLTGLDDEKLGIEAVKQGAQDYLVKGQLSGKMLCRVLCYTIERHGLQVELEKARQRKQEDLELVQSIRNHKLYLAISKGNGISEKDSTSISDEATLNSLISKYTGITFKYLHAIRLQEDRPSELIREFARQLASMHVKAREVVTIHVNVLNNYSKRATPMEERAFSNDTRIVLVELMGNIIDIYLNSFKNKEEVNYE